MTASYSDNPGKMRLTSATAVFCGRLMSTPSGFGRELSRSVRRCPCLTVVKTVVKTTFYHGKVEVQGFLPRFT
jgi:hypothetical protein